ncbi:hypothetical protein [Arachnia propionica]|uniref:Uncharacterized protein n=1 Tax=Arachnia propionica TaxID=1750 RepID=A0A3P1WS42_9ACTN|nr:hypothetical protein [Arachnia propionica]RRD48786.1 hypothetical protein EII35_11305 [Arachnia propionica]
METVTGGGGDPDRLHACMAECLKRRNELQALQDLDVALGELDRERFPGVWAAGKLVSVQVRVRMRRQWPGPAVRELVEVFDHADGTVWWFGEHIPSTELQEKVLDEVWDIVLNNGVLQLHDADRGMPSCITEAADLLERGVALAEAAGDRAKVVESTIRLSSARIARGRTEEGLGLAAQARREAETLGDARLLCRARLPLIVAALHHRDRNQTLALLEELLRASRRAGDKQMLTWARQQLRDIRAAQRYARRARRQGWRHPGAGVATR